jgi:hypothetical protein
MPSTSREATAYLPPPSWSRWAPTCTAFALRAIARQTTSRAPWQEDVARAFTGETAYSNRNACGPESPLRDPCYAWQRTDALVPVLGQDYDDLVLTGSGTQPPPEPEAVRTAKPARLHGKQKPEPPPVPAAIPYTSVERLRFRDGKYTPLPDTDATIPPH